MKTKVNLKKLILGEGGTSLWTKSFIIIIVGSFVSLAGANTISTALGLYILDVTKSKFMYSVVLAVGNVSGIVVPIIAASLLDRFSRRKIIYSFDFINASLLFIMAGLNWFGFVNGAVVLVYCFIIGLLNNIYRLAYESYVPLVVEKSLYSKAYSVSSIVTTLAETAILLGIFFYESFGLFPVLIVSGVFYFVAACFETTIKVDNVIEKSDGQNPLKQYKRDFEESFRYLKINKGLFAISIFVILQNISLGAFYADVLPYFRDSAPNGEYIYVLVMAGMSTGQFWGGLINYRLKLKPSHRMVFFCVCVLVQFICMTVFVFTGLVIMIFLMVIAGILEIITYSMRGAVIYQGLPDNMVARYTGIFQAFMMFGYVVGNLSGGLLCEYFPISIALLVTNGVTVVGLLVIFSVFGKPLSKMFSTAVISETSTPGQPET